MNISNLSLVPSQGEEQPCVLPVQNKIIFTQYKSSDPLSKRYYLEAGEIQKQAAAQMYKGTAERVTMPFADFPNALSKARENQAFGYGLHPLNYPDKVNIVVAGKEQPEKHSIARTQKFYAYTEGPGVEMFDHDPNKYGPVMSSVQLIQALIEIHPAIAQAARVVRGSVSAGVHKTGEIPRADKGFHIYVPVKNAADIPRYGKVIFDRLGHTADDSNKQQALGYTMQLYTKALGIVAPPNTANAKYPPVKDPRFTTVATSTTDAMVNIMTGDHARAGAFNRFVVTVAEKTEAKKYEGFTWNPGHDLIDLLSWVRGHEGGVIKFTDEAWSYFKEIDTEKFEAIKAADPKMGGRLSEQAIKEAGRIALSNRQMSITKAYLETAFNNRLSLYERARHKFAAEYAMSDKHDTVIAKEQILRALRRREKVYKSQFSVFSRKYDALSVNDQISVVKALLMDGAMSSTKGSVFISLVFRRKT
jgi:hypothetical protein